MGTNAEGIAIDGNGSLYVTSNAAATAYTDIINLSSWTAGSAVGVGNRFGPELFSAQGIAVDASGNVYVSDQLGTSGSPGDYVIQDLTSSAATTFYNSGGSTTGTYNYRFFTFAPVPEPAALGLLGVGVMAGALRRRRRTTPAC